MSPVTFAQLLATPPVPRAELARRAGLSRNTEWSVRHDQSRARLDTIRELALACGYDIDLALRPAYEPSAVAAAREMLGDLGDPGHRREQQLHEELEQWRRRLLRYVADEDPLTLAAEAGRLAAPQHAPGATLFAGRNDVDRLMSAGVATRAETARDTGRGSGTGAEAETGAASAGPTGAAWVFSARASLEALGALADPRPWVKLPTVVWTAAPKQFSQQLAGTHRRVNALGAADVIVAPLEPHHLVGMGEVEGIPLVSPVQAVIDCLGIGGDAASVAHELANGW